ncbi:hypothetical protein [Sinomonas sp. R1AF57]|uniref:hypothetical protein n=1 Tax=Sinomonas TaxID=596707 RepID=UPI000B61453C|nr:hypothetical protein [Sinomonas sp. R1AF57]ASN52573.1 hypothetical protein CGQ25_11205 [Sinomonas sp. R1AF57]
MDFRVLSLGDKVVFHDAGPEPFNVRAVSPDHRIVILSRPLQGGTSAEYTMIDWDKERRGSDGTQGRGFVVGSSVHGHLHRFFHGHRQDAGAEHLATQSVMTFGNWTMVSIATVNGQP